MLGLGAAGIVVGSKVQDVFSRVLQPVTAADPSGITSLIPAANHFRIYTVTGDLPQRGAADYTLKVGGLVDHPLQLTFADLQAMPPLRVVKDFQCVTGWRVPQVPWTGVRLSDLLDRAGVHADGHALTFTSFDGEYTESLTLDQARRSDVMVAYAMEDKPISSAHGGPVRLYVAPMYGYKSCKWLSEISVVPKVEAGYWEVRGYDVDAWIGKSNGRDDAPT
jgi:DMSO/TMAO reductase YedYZ molybdopterin-dependent catalytic subunit